MGLPGFPTGGGGSLTPLAPLVQSGSNLGLEYGPTLQESGGALDVRYGTGSNTAVQGNDSRMPPTPTGAGKVAYDTGAGYAVSAAGTSTQVLHGGNTPGFSAVDLTNDVTGTLSVNSIGSGYYRLYAATGADASGGAQTIAITGIATTNRVESVFNLTDASDVTGAFAAVPPGANQITQSTMNLAGKSLLVMVAKKTA